MRATTELLGLGAVLDPEEPTTNARRAVFEVLPRLCLILPPTRPTRRTRSWNIFYKHILTVRY